MEGILDTVMNGLEDAAKWVVMLLPSSPFTAISTSAIQPYIQNLGWILPIPEMLAVLQAWGTAVGVYYVYQAILRFTKMVE